MVHIRGKPAAMNPFKEIQMSNVDGFVRSRHPGEPARGLPASGGRTRTGVQVFCRCSKNLDSGFHPPQADSPE
jgi:hypothetical protein